MLRVVIVEDEDIIRMGLVKTIDWAAMNAQVVGEAANGLEGLAVIRETKPDVVFTDIKMPRMDGLALGDRLQQENLSVQLVFLTSYAEFAYAQQALRLRARDYLLKPVDEQQLASLMAEIQTEIDVEQEMQASGPAVEDKTKENGGLTETELTYARLDKLIAWKKILERQGLNPYVRRTLVRIESDYGKRIGIDDVSAEMSVSTSYLSRKLKEFTGSTFVEIMTSRRLVEAVKLLEDGTYKMYEVADKAGFSEYKNLITAFKKYLGTTPKRFRDMREKEY